MIDRRSLVLAGALAVPTRALAGKAQGMARVSIVRFGARADVATINTRPIQATIDHLAGRGGGVVVVPRGVFVTGALFLKPGVHLHLDDGAVLRCTTDMTHFPPMRTRIEGHFEERFTPALINAKRCDGLRITGPGVLDGAGRPVWDRFWKLRNAAPDPHNFPNIGIPRARLMLIEESRDVVVEGPTFRDSQFWNLHLYKCRDVTVRGARFEVPDDYPQAPSSDGVDLDSCQHVTIEDCYFSVTDDCVAVKGTKGPNALADRDSPPVEHVRVRRCHFRRGHHALACGSEATIVRDVTVEDCRVTGHMVLAMFKLRPDTPQRYEQVHFRDIVLDDAPERSDGRGAIVTIAPWSQYVDLKGAAPPQSTVSHITFTNITGRFAAFGSIAPNPGQTTIRDVVLRDVDVTLVDRSLRVTGTQGVRFANVRVNGRAVAAPQPSPPAARSA